MRAVAHGVILGAHYFFGHVHLRCGADGLDCHDSLHDLMIAALIVQYVRCVGWNCECQCAYLGAVASDCRGIYHRGAAVLCQSGHERFRHDVEWVPRGLQSKFISVAPVKSDCGIGCVPVCAERVGRIAHMIHCYLCH